MKRFYVSINVSTLFLLLTALISVGICENINETIDNLFNNCLNNVCDMIQCPPVTECPNGEIINSASLCGCCPLCVSYIEKGELCGQGPTAAASLCKPGLSCNKDTKRCDEQNGPCVEERNHRLSLLENKDYNFTESLWLPECDSNGNFKKKQCKGSKCLCFDENGNRIFGLAERALAENMTCECSREMWKRKNDEGLEWMTSPHEHCDSMGNYDELQCKDEICYCADPITGDPMGEATHIAGFHLLSCYNEETHGKTYLRQCEKQLYRAQSLTYQFHNKGIRILGLVNIACGLDGTFDLKQCQPDRCSCTNKFGASIKSYTKEKSSGITNKMICACARDQNDIETNHARYPLLDCTDLGNFKEYQCFGDECFCVDRDGVQISQTEQLVPEVVGNCIKMDKCLYESSEC
ncbi:thyroglobulin-like [Limulus polyphemus]|uniref:Thyroglobulin-like n=1 Tax=Limulus polyphemus TaxID=6850 RepID=A0ABM1RV67_LIMPO|nr:thyroglobulin-like [Limulus polyphemus]